MSRMLRLLSLSSCYLFSSLVVAEENPLTRFIDNAQYEVDSSVTGYFKKVASDKADNDDVAFATRLTAKSQTQLSEHISAGMEFYATYSSQKKAYSDAFRNPGDRSRQPKIFDFNSAWLRYERDDFEIMAGKDYLQTGLSEVYSPVDRFGIYNLTNPTQVYRTGVWQTGINYFVDDDTLSFKVMPIPEKNLIPSVYSRWLGNTNDPEFTFLAANYQIEEKFRPVRIENAGYLLQYKGTRVGYDFFGLLHHGPSIYPILTYGTRINQRIKTEPLATSISAGVLKVIEEWKFSGEAIYQIADKNTDEDFIRYSVSIGYTDSQFANLLGLNQMTTTLQWSGDEVVDAENSSLVATSSRAARPFRNSALTKIEIEQNQQWGYFFTAAYNIAGNVGLFGGTQYKPTDNLSLRLEGGYFNGAKDTLFGRWQNNDFVRLHTIYKF
ncbi:MAG: outer membrane protein [Gammaproteobacteria bacterium]